MATYRRWGGLLAALLLLALLWAAWPAEAGPANRINVGRITGPWEAETPSAPSAPNPIGTTAPGATPAATTAVTPTSTIVENVFHIISFPFQTMTDAVVQMSNRIMLQAYRDAGQRLSGAMDQLVFGDYGLAPTVAPGAATPLFARLIWPHWQVTMAIALLLVPVTLLLTAVSSLRLGATSALGLVDLKEALLGWLIAVGAAGSSYYLLSLAHRLSVAAALSILRVDGGQRVTGDTLAGAFFNVQALLAAAGNVLTAPIVLYLAFFALFLASSVLFGLGLALAAYTALAYLLTTIAPLVLVLGALPPLRWLQGLWLKSVTIVFLVPVVDALLIKAAVFLFYDLLNAEGSGNLGTFLSGVFVTAGVISVLITVNYKVGETVFAALGEVHRRAWEATTGVASLVALAGGMAIGGLAVGAGAAAAGGTSLASGTAVGTVANGGGAATGGATAAGGSAAAAANSQASSAGMTSSGGSSVATRLAALGSGQPSASSTSSTSGIETGSASTSMPSGHQDNEVSENGRAMPSDGSGHNTTSGSSGHTQPEADRSGSAELAHGLGRALTLGIQNPVLRGMGAGLQIGTTLGEHQLRNAASRPQSGQTPAAQRPADLDAALRWSKQNLSDWPNDLFTLGRDNTLLMAGGLHQAFVGTGRATHMEDMVSVARASYGAWHAQGEPGGLAAQRVSKEACSKRDQRMHVKIQ